MSALVLRIIACATMLLDHIGYHWNIFSLRLIGRMAFPLFVFLLVNGYRHTSCRWKYLLRLVVFVLISQIPFSLLIYGQLLSTTGNVFFTLAVSLVCLWTFDLLWQRKQTRWCALLPTIALFALFQFGVLQADYGVKGILLAFLFRYCNLKKPLGIVIAALGMIFINFFPFLYSLAFNCALMLIGRTPQMPTVSLWSFYQLLWLLVLPLICLYNGKKGPSPQLKLPAKALQLGFYVFYPAHMLLLYFL